MSNLFEKLNEDQLDSLIGALDTAAALPPGLHGTPYDHEQVMWMSREAAIAYMGLAKKKEEEEKRRQPSVEITTGRTEDGERVFIHHFRDPNAFSAVLRDVYTITIDDERHDVKQILQGRGRNAPLRIQLWGSREIVFPNGWKGEYTPTLDGKEFD